MEGAPQWLQGAAEVHQVLIDLRASIGADPPGPGAPSLRQTVADLRASIGVPPGQTVHQRLVAIEVILGVGTSVGPQQTAARAANKAAKLKDELVILRNARGEHPPDSVFFGEPPHVDAVEIALVTKKWFMSVRSERLRAIARFYAREVEHLVGAPPLSPVQMAANAQNRLQKTNGEITAMSADDVRECISNYYGLY